jgi:chromosome segregation ATPase
MFGVLLSSGCQNWPQSKRAMQAQIESERLLSEFRAQKKRADELETRNQQLSQRLSESEKMLARLQSTSPVNQTAARDPEPFSTSSYSSAPPIADNKRPSLGNDSQPTWRPIKRQ